MTKMLEPSKYNVLVSTRSYFILYNMISKSLILIDHKQISNEEWIELVENGFFTDSSASDEFEEAKANFLDSQEDSSYISLTIIPTYQCNLKCKYCYETHNQIRKENMLKIVEEGVIKTLKQSIGLKSFHVEWFGGEPSLYKEEVCDVSFSFKNVCESLGIGYTAAMNTNLYKISLKDIELYKRAGITSISTSLAGWKDCNDLYRVDINGNGTYEQTVKNILAIHNQIPVSICINITKQSVSDIQLLFDDLDNLDKNKITLSFIRVFDAGLRSDLDSIYLSLEEYSEVYPRLCELAIKNGFHIAIDCNFSGKCLYCGVQHINSFTISPECGIYKCVDNYDKRKPIGFLDQEGIHLNDEWTYTNPYLREPCALCKFLPYCNGGCTYMYSIGDNFCPLEKTIFPQILYLYVLSKVKDQDKVIFNKLLGDGISSVKMIPFSNILMKGGEIND